MTRVPVPDDRGDDAVAVPVEDLPDAYLEGNDPGPHGYTAVVETDGDGRYVGVHEAVAPVLAAVWRREFGGYDFEPEVGGEDGGGSATVVEPDADEDEDVDEPASAASVDDGSEDLPPFDPGAYTVDELRERLDQVVDADALRSVHDLEANGEDRDTALDAIDARLDEVAAAESERRADAEDGAEPDEDAAEEG